jgi:hypothetical protein
VGTSAIEWADRQRRLRTDVMSPDFDPELRDVQYQLVHRRDFGDGWSPFLPVLMGWVRTGREVALWLDPDARASAPSRAPDLVFRVDEIDPLGGAAASGEGEVFGELVPGGVLGVLVGHAIVWPTYPPRAGTAADARRAARAARSSLGS